MAKPTTKTESLITIRREINKQGFVYDGSNRTLKIYTAPIFAVAGDQCHVREFLYYPSTNIVKGRKEGYDVWLQLFDDAYSVNDLVDDMSNNLVDDFGNQLTT